MLILIKKFKPLRLILFFGIDRLFFGILKNYDKVSSLKETHDYANDNFSQYLGNAFSEEEVVKASHVLKFFQVNR